MTVRVLALAIMLAAGALAPLRSADAQGALFGDWRPPPPMIDSPAFALRSPLPGHPGYLETIAYIDDGLKYVDSKRAFFVSRDGRMCFVGVLNVRRTDRAGQNRRGRERHHLRSAVAFMVPARRPPMLPGKRQILPQSQQHCGGDYSLIWGEGCGRVPGLFDGRQDSGRTALKESAFLAGLPSEMSDRFLL